MSEESKTQNHTTVVKESVGGGAGWFIALLLLVALGFGAWYLYNNQPASNDASLNVNVSVPDELTQ